MKNTIILFTTALLLASCSGENNDFQKDADIVRLNHLVYYGALITEYKEKTGSYPFEKNADVPVYAFIVSPEQCDDLSSDGPKFPHKTTTSRYFFEELEAGLGRNIDEYYDPQYAPDKKPNFYIYNFQDSYYNFAVHLGGEYSFANPVAPGYNKVEITNSAPSNSHLILYEDLLQNEDYQRAREQTLKKPDFFAAREKKFLHSTDCKADCLKLRGAQ